MSFKDWSAAQNGQKHSHAKGKPGDAPKDGSVASQTKVAADKASPESATGSKAK
jgi:hypothetical protein